MTTTVDITRHLNSDTPAETLVRSGPGALSDCELLSLFLQPFPAR